MPTNPSMVGVFNLFLSTAICNSNYKYFQPSTSRSSHFIYDYKRFKRKGRLDFFAVPTDVDCTGWLSNMLHDYEADDIDELKSYMYDCGEPRRAYSIIYCCAYDVSDNCTYFGYGKTRQIALRDLHEQLK